MSVILLIFCTVLFLFFQYRDYKSNYHVLDDVRFLPGDYYSAPEEYRITLPYNTTYMRIKNIDGEEVLKQIKITADPLFEYTIRKGIPKEIEEKVFEPGREFMRRNNTNDALTEEEIDTYVEEAKKESFPDNELVIERTGEVLEKNTMYTITLAYKRWNIFNGILGENKDVTYTLNIGEEEGDQIADLKQNYESGMTSYLLFGGEKYKKEQEKEAQACPFSELQLESEVILMNRSNSNFELGYIDCPYLNGEEGPEVANIKIYSEDIEEGKKEFIRWMKSKGFEESEDLIIQYTHEPEE